MNSFTCWFFCFSSFMIIFKTLRAIRFSNNLVYTNSVLFLFGRRNQWRSNNSNWSFDRLTMRVIINIFKLCEDWNLNWLWMWILLFTMFWFSWAMILIRTLLSSCVILLFFNFFFFWATILFMVLLTFSF